MIDSTDRAHEIPINELKFILTKLSTARVSMFSISIQRLKWTWKTPIR